MMRHLKRLQDNGAQLVVTEFQEGQYVEFADAAVNLVIQAQEDALANLTLAEKGDAIETILKPLPEDEKEPARNCILRQLHRSESARGLNHVEALLYSVAHSGRLITYEEYLAMAQADKHVVECLTNTWFFKNIADVIQSESIHSFGGFGVGSRSGGYVGNDNRYGADYRGTVGRDVPRGGRVAGLRVQIS